MHDALGALLRNDRHEVVVAGATSQPRIALGDGERELARGVRRSVVHAPRGYLVGVTELGTQPPALGSHLALRDEGGDDCRR